MGQAKKQMMEEEKYSDVEEFLSALMSKDELNPALTGITKQIKSKGLKSLTENQRKAVDNLITFYENKHKCERCSNGNVSSLIDLIEVAENGLCSTCEYDREKFMRD